MLPTNRYLSLPIGQSCGNTGIILDSFHEAVQFGKVLCLHDQEEVVVSEDMNEGQKLLIYCCEWPIIAAVLSSIEHSGTSINNSGNLYDKDFRTSCAIWRMQASSTLF